MSRKAREHAASAAARGERGKVANKLRGFRRKETKCARSVGKRLLVVTRVGCVRAHGEEGECWVCLRCASEERRLAHDCTHVPARRFRRGDVEAGRLNAVAHEGFKLAAVAEPCDRGARMLVRGSRRVKRNAAHEGRGIAAAVLNSGKYVCHDSMFCRSRGSFQCPVILGGRGGLWGQTGGHNHEEKWGLRGSHRVCKVGDITSKGMIRNPRASGPRSDRCGFVESGYHTTRCTLDPGSAPGRRSKGRLLFGPDPIPRTCLFFTDRRRAH